MTPIQKVVVLGGGSAGFIAALTLKTKLPQLAVQIIRSPQIGIIGVGEGTTFGVPKHLHAYLNISHEDLFRAASPTWKLGIRFQWGKRSHFNYTFQNQVDGRWPELSRTHGFYCFDDFTNVDLASALMDVGNAFPETQDRQPVVPNFTAYHFENESFVSFLEQKARALGVTIQDANVQTVRRDENGIQALHLDTGEDQTADLFLDASGFQSLLLGQTLKEPYGDYRKSLFCDRAVVGGWAREGEPILPYTTVDTMQSGWSWQIEHENRINRGYVYCSSFTTDEQAEEEFRRANPKLGPTRIVNFPSGRHQRFWVGNVVGIGNAAGFVEPLEATSLAAICDEARYLVEALYDCQCRPTNSIQYAYNAAMGTIWDTIRDFLAVHYKFNNRLATEFWRACQQDVDLGGATALVEYYQENGPSLFGRHMLLNPLDQFGLEGYFVLLLGQQVPYEAKFAPSAEERKLFRERCERHSRIAAAAQPIEKVLAGLQRPNWFPQVQPIQRQLSSIPAAKK